MVQYQWLIKDNSLYLGLSSITKENKSRNQYYLEKELSLRNLQVDKIDFLLNNSMKEIKVADLSNADLDGKFMVEISKDLQTASIIIFPPIDAGRKVTFTDIKKQLGEKGIKYGIDEVKIMIALSQAIVVEETIALGKLPQPGKNAEIKYYFNPKGIDVQPTELENGKVDFYNVNLIQNVKNNQLLVEKIPATKGVPGITVTGAEIPAKDGKDTRLPLGKNVAPSPDLLKGYATCEGHVVFTDKKVSVLPVYEVTGDIDFSTGNIEYSGNVIIRGNVKTNFIVKSSGDVEIYGNIEGGHVYAEGNIIIKKGIRGLKKSGVTAKGNIYADFIEHANVYAGADIIVNEAIMHSNVESYNTIQVGGRKGLIVGGLCRAGRGIECKNMGSNLATVTKIEVGINPELRNKFNEISKELLNVAENLDKTLKALKLLSEIKEKIEKLPADKEALFSRLLKTREELITQQNSLVVDKQNAEEEIKKLDEGYVKISGALNNGVNISIGRASKFITSEHYGVHLIQDGLDIKTLKISQ